MKRDKDDSQTERPEEEDVKVSLSTKDKKKSEASHEAAHTEKRRGAREKKGRSRDEMKLELEKKDKELEEMYDRLLRTQAEFENYKKRMDRERGEISRHVRGEIMREMLGVKDDLERAIDHAQNSQDAQGIATGIEMVLSDFSKRLERLGVKEFNSVGEVFDPNRHEAMVQVESTDYEENTIVSEFKKGYVMDGQLLRPALVTVAKPPAQEEAGKATGSEKAQEASESAKDVGPTGIE
jgi:molecular chaperone GrpE